MAGFDFDDTAIGEAMTFGTFGCRVFRNNPDTPDRLRPDIAFTRKFYGDKITMPDGRRVEIWGFEDPASPIRAPFPSAPIRVREGQVVHTTIEASKGSHTIHHHAINGSPFNDGVGHTSFEVTGSYTYQWYAREAGTFFYHCHKNTVLHFEMGMYGLLVIDPPEGPGRAFTNGPRYDVERAWVADDIDPAWRLLDDHDAGLCGHDVGLNKFNPQYFLVSGVPAQRTRSDQRVAVRARVGQSVLIRLLNASYSILRVTFGLPVRVVAADGHPLGVRDRPWSRAFTIPAGEPFELTSAQRYDLIIDVPAPGRFPARLEFLHWITREIQHGGRGVAESEIVVTA